MNTVDVKPASLPIGMEDGETSQCGRAKSLLVRSAGLRECGIVTHVYLS